MEHQRRMVKIELEAAEALAGLAHVPTTTKSVSNGGSESVVEGVKDESNDCSNSSFNNNNTTSYEVATNSTGKRPGILTTNSVNNEQNTKLRLSPSNPTNCASSGRRSRQNLTEAEIEARKIRRVLANRESARQTIRRRQAVFEELSRKAVDLAWENDNLKKEKENASKQYDSLKTKNKCLKAHMTKIKSNEAEEAREESITTNEPTISTSSTNSPFIVYNQPSFLPFVWPSPVQLQCGSAAGIVFPSHIPVDSSSCDRSSTTPPLYLVPYPWLVTLPQNENNEENRPHSFNLNDKPKGESSECQQLFPEKSEGTAASPPDGCTRQQPTDCVSCEEPLIQHDTYTFLKAPTPTDEHGVGGLNKIHQVPVVCSGKRSGAASEARKRRKELTRLKNHFNCRQLRMH